MRDFPSWLYGSSIHSALDRAMAHESEYRERERAIKAEAKRGIKDIEDFLKDK